MQRMTVAHVDCEAIRQNFALTCSLAPDSQPLAIIKADAYGHGIARVAEALEGLAPLFGVATIDEALSLREAGIEAPLLVLEGVNTREAAATAAAENLLLIVHSSGQVDQLAGLGIGAWLKVDTGMHRLGVDVSEIDEVLRRLREATVDVQAICTHLACADEVQNPATPRQLQAFDAAVADLSLPQSIANSAAIIAWPESHRNWIRPGLMLYGVSPMHHDNPVLSGLRPAMTLSSEIIAIRKVNAGDAVGYGGRWVAERASRIATIAVGYADGYPRHAPDGTPVCVGEHQVSLAGTVSMDMITVDVTDHDEIRVGDPVELWGRHLAVDVVARAAGMISYELLSGVTSRVPRVYE